MTSHDLNHVSHSSSQNVKVTWSKWPPSTMSGARWPISCVNFPVASDMWDLIGRNKEYGFSPKPSRLFSLVHRHFWSVIQCICLLLWYVRGRPLRRPRLVFHRMKPKSHYVDFHRGHKPWNGDVTGKFCDKSVCVALMEFSLKQDTGKDRTADFAARSAQ